MKEDIIIENVVVQDVEETRKKKKKTWIGKMALSVMTGTLCGVVAAGSVIGYQDYKEKQAIRLEQETETPIISEEVQGMSDKAPLVESLQEANLSNETTVYDVSPVVRNVMPAIVSINCKGIAVQYDFFGRQYESETSGSGSGIIIAQNGDELLIVTNHHVVDGMTKLEIVFADDTTAEAVIKGTQQQDDLAVVSVDFSDISDTTKQKIRVATLGDSNALEAGDMVIAIGNALGYGQSVTVGYVSAVNREVTIDNIKMTLIQTDAAINPGNSGGALLNAKGEVIGINNAKLVSSSIEGVGYAIPISHAIPIISELMNREELEVTQRAYMGITGKDVTESLSTALNLPVGIYINTVEKDSPAEQAGIKPYSIITAVNGKEVMNLDSLKQMLSYIKGGTTGTVTVQELINGVYTEKTYDITFGYQSN